MSRPKVNGPNGRDGSGRFVRGNPGGPGNPHARKVQQLRAALLAAVKPKDLREVTRALLGKAKAGDVAAVKELLDRTLGKAPQALELTGAEGEPLGLPSLTVILMEVLAGFPEARAAVAARLVQLSHERPHDAGGGA